MTGTLDLTRAARRADEGVRRVEDIALSLAGLALLSPLLLVIAACVRWSSPGPILFSQERVGKDGRYFRILKFRSMKTGSRGPSVTSADDDRVTGVGRRLRAFKLDELPQLFNVLRGDMSFVGPRPEVPRYVARYSDAEREVLSVRPGVTGVCQLAYRDEESLLQGCADPEEAYLRHIMPAKLALDLDYLRRRTLSADLGVLMRTFSALLGRNAEGAAERHRLDQALPPLWQLQGNAPLLGSKGGSTQSGASGPGSEKEAAS